MGGITTFEREFGAIFKMPADANERLRTLQLQTSVMLVLTAIQRRRKRERQIVRRKHRFWIQEIFKNRQNFGTFHTLAQELQLHERESSLKEKPSQDARKLIFFLKNKGLLAYTLKEQLYRVVLAYDELNYRMVSLCAMHSGKHFCRYRHY